MSLRRFLFIVFLSFSGLAATAQGNVADSTLRMALFQFHGGFLQPFGDVGKLYGTYADVGFSFAYKSGKNVLLGADFTYMFGDQVNNSWMLFQQLRTSSGQIINVEGETLNYLIQTRGIATGFYTGKIFPIFGPNPNSGLEVRLGVNYLEHRTRIETRADDFPPLQDEYLKGYDRKRAGIALHQFIGYRHFGNNRYVNFFAGFDIYEGFTTDYRSYNIDQMQKTNGDYFDVLTGFRFGWTLPVYKQKADKFYIN